MKNTFIAILLVIISLLVWKEMSAKSTAQPPTETKSVTVPFRIKKTEYALYQMVASRQSENWRQDKLMETIVKPAGDQFDLLEPVTVYVPAGVLREIKNTKSGDFWAVPMARSATGKWELTTWEKYDEAMAQ